MIFTSYFSVAEHRTLTREPCSGKILLGVILCAPVKKPVMLIIDFGIG